MVYTNPTPFACQTSQTILKSRELAQEQRTIPYTIIDFHPTI